MVGEGESASWFLVLGVEAEVGFKFYRKPYQPSLRTCRREPDADKNPTLQPNP